MPDKFDAMAKQWLIQNHFNTAGGNTGNLANLLRSAATVPEGHVRQGTKDMPLLGTLPVTADGCVVGLGSVIWNCRIGSQFKVSDHTLWGDGDTNNLPVAGAVMWPQAGRPETWYSTREAAEAARAGRAP